MTAGSGADTQDGLALNRECCSAGGCQPTRSPGCAPQGPVLTGNDGLFSTEVRQAFRRPRTSPLLGSRREGGE